MLSWVIPRDESPIWQDAQYALDAANPAPRWVALDDLELEPTPCLGDDEGLGRREPAELARIGTEEASTAALGADTQAEWLRWSAGKA